MIMRLRVLFLPAMAIGLRILPAVPSRREVLGAVAAISVYGLPPAVVAEEGEMARQTLGLQTAYGTDPWASSAPPEKLLASYDKMLLQRAREELGSSSTSEAQTLVSLISMLEKYEWSNLASAVGKLGNDDNPQLAAVIAACQKTDAQKAAKALLEIADELEVSAYVSPRDTQTYAPPRR